MSTVYNIRKEQLCPGKRNIRQMSKNETPTSEIVKDTTTKTEKPLEKNECRDIGKKRRKCIKCKKNRMFKFFSKDVDKKFNISNKCKDCNKKQNKLHKKNRKRPYKQRKLTIKDSNGKTLKREQEDCANSNWNLNNAKFGKWKVIKRAKMDRFGNIYWLCECSCAAKTKKRVSANSLVRGVSKGCGCSRALPLGEAAFNSLYNAYTFNAKNRNLQFNISKKCFKRLTSSNCFYCGKPPQSKKTSTKHYTFNGDYIYNGIDRVNNKIGYTNKNTIPCCFRCNKIKNRWHQKEFLTTVKEIYENLYK